ncbi:MAG: bifunctional diaminohydroxyphosphoribosylaminopyrimidine deaminase/5-amino-6-(5-phosphoribosylamino)uracil reductase RibD [Bacteroidota bacterium]|nr:bifunctional diaminohydroxyphosphoribosylaminopyrimidine deaminase/5-amino-6-(5-phosphoribosylamino)uracil reductase RibD [Bacteroidota bacterium]
MNHDVFMKHAITLAQKGLGSVSPNPLVGCVIVKDGLPAGKAEKIVAEGYHQIYGEAHAEVNAIHNLPKDIDPKDCTLYVSLEPCCHDGKTPPCADLIISKGFKKVVICNVDPNPLIAGKGIKKLKQAGIEIIQGICEKEGRYLNRRFFTFHEKKRPYIILKWAQTADGFISKWPIPKNRSENKISGEEAQKLVHQMRANEDAILVGKNTVLNDDPYLTTRLAEGKNPMRIIITGSEIPFTYNIFNEDARIVLFNRFKTEVKDHVHYIKLKAGDVVPQILESLYKMGVSSVLVEGGLFTLSSFIVAGIWDEQHVFVNAKLNFMTGVKAPKKLLATDFQLVGSDSYYIIANTSSSK